MARIYKPGDIEQVSGAIDEAARKAARDKWRDMLHPEPAPGDASPHPVRHAELVFPVNRTRARITDDPQKPDTFGLDVTGKNGAPVNVPGIGGMQGGHADVDPRHLGDALKEVNKHDKNLSVAKAR